MESKEKELLVLLKNRLLENIKLNNDVFGPLDISEGKREFYFNKIEDNCFQNKKGKHLKSDSRAIRSSATMIYNTLGEKNNKIVFNTKETYMVNNYEEILPGLKNRTGPHLDVTLKTKDDDKIIFIESKCLEWLSTSEKMLNVYLDSDNYLYGYDEKFIPWFKKFLEISEKERNEYSSIYTRYNSKQMNIHIFGIFNYCCQLKKDDKNKLPKEIKLWNIIWDYSDIEEYQTEKQEGQDYCEKANKYFSDLFKNVFGIIFNVEYIGYSEFLGMIDWSNNKIRRDYLKRYEIALNKKCMSDSEFLERYDEMWEKTWHFGDKPKVFDNNEKLPFNDIIHENLDGEIWKELTHIKGYTKYAVSNLGRVKYDGHIIPQSDEKQTGYLRLGQNSDYYVDHHICVYTLIAIGFLGKNFSDGYDVHHIDNNGYDCRVQNLQLLTRKQHNAVHCKREYKEYYMKLIKDTNY